MRLRIDKHSNEPLHSQLTGQIRAGIATGRLRSGQLMPGVRGLAGLLGINRNTVAKAYKALVAEGTLTVNRGLGVSVSRRTLPHSRVRRAVLRADVDRAVLCAHALGLGRDDLLSLVSARYETFARA